MSKSMDYYPLWKNMRKTMGKSFGKITSSKFGWKLLNTTKKLATYVFKTAIKRGILKTAEATGDLVGSKIAEKITKNT